MGSSIEELVLERINESLIRPEPPETKACKEDFIRFSEIVMGRKDMYFHTLVRKKLMSSRRLVVMLPRGFGKSTIMIDYCLWRLARDRDIRIIIATSALRLAMEWLREIENHLLHNTVFRELFGNLVPEPRTLTWTDTEKIVLGRSTKATHTSLYAISVGGSTLGKRADLIIADDILEPELGIPTETQLNRVKEWFWKVLYPVLEPNGQIVVQGTRFADGDIYGSLAEMKGWDSVIISALDENGKSRWEERFPTEELLARRESMGSILFNLQYMNHVTQVSGLDPGWLQVIDESEIPNDLIIYQGVDPSISAAPNADYAVIATVGTSPSTKKVYLLHIFRAHCSMMQLSEYIQAYANLYQPRLIAIETNAAQVFLRDYLVSENMLPIRGVASEKNKMNRFVSMSALFESGKVLLKGKRASDGSIVPDPSLEPFIEEWKRFPVSKNDDTLDAVEKALSVAVYTSPPPASMFSESEKSLIEAMHYSRRKGGLLFKRVQVPWETIQNR